MTNVYLFVTNAVFAFFELICINSVNAYSNYSVRIYTYCVITRKLYKSFVNLNIDGRSKTD